MTKVTSDLRTQAGIAFDLPPPPRLTPDEVAEFAIELGRLWYASEIELLRDTGERIIKRLYRGSVELYEQYNRGDLSVTEVVEYLRGNDFPGWNHSRVDNSVLVYDLGVKLGGFKQFDNLGVTHLLAVAGLKFEEQEALLREANAKALSATELEEMVRSRRAKQKRSQGKELSLIRRALARVGSIERALHGHEEWMQDVTAAGLDAEAVKRFDAAIDACVHEAELAEQELAKRLPPKKEKKARPPKRKAAGT